VSEKKIIQDKLKKKEAEISGLEEKIKAARVYISALHDILKMLDKEDVGTTSDATLRPGSAVAQARDVILTKGVPVHIDEILDLTGKGSSREAKASLTSSLAAYVRRGDIFTRPAPNTFGLLELGHNNSDGDPLEPPNDFGNQNSDT
jgi:hypothetical protein